MSCCAPSDFVPLAQGPDTRAQEITLGSRQLEPTLWQTDLSVPSIHCGGCIAKIETALGKVPGIVAPRVNLSTRRVTIKWHDAAAAQAAIDTVQTLGYPCHVFDDTQPQRDEAFHKLILALAVAAFSSMNIMMLSIGVWAGATGSTRDVFHAIAGLLCLPAFLYSGQVFYKSAFDALRHKTTNMDVPIAIGLILAFALSVYETMISSDQAYFDAVATLIFFLLAGRTLDHMMRARARSAVDGLARLAARGAMVVEPNGQTTYRPTAELAPGMEIMLAAGERVPVDGEVIDGISEIDSSLVNGESQPLTVATGSALRAGTLNLSSPIRLRATAAAKDSFLAEMTRMMEAAESGRGAYRTLADRVSRHYTPVVNIAAALALVLWLILGAGVHQSITIAISVLIITCPCALGLAVPMVQVVAARRLFTRRIMLRDGAALEQLATIDTVVFDKTGTLTLGQPQLKRADAVSTDLLAIAAALAGHSLHPYSQAVSAAARTRQIGLSQPEDVREHAGLGVEGRLDGHVWRLGRAGWASADGVGQVILARDGKAQAAFDFEDTERPGLHEAIDDLKRRGLNVELLSGDSAPVVAELAQRLGIETARGEVYPADKLARIRKLQAQGRKVLMVGDGLNDSPALAAADVSMAPANAADVGRNAAGLVFLSESLDAVPYAIETAHQSRRLVTQNFVLAIGYNAIALPVAFLGHITPLAAAIAMSSSSIIVVANALRLVRPSEKKTHHE
ncbi:MAG TPA: heavy metal translocating P-type ATPase [Pelagibacterium sp.]|uniref:heavy metal translocating P-type ATPase n=1 Tax=Pelagibacterium sp. TaxID=1967288 RepID=UPI002CE44D95|nr:heavy metal translocating P-type ATPase [Pelagibacterium sp.]HWJ88257.1 heavy metal translocating P-type ATPase [Pelagibacterium sp.]